MNEKTNTTMSIDSTVLPSTMSSSKRSVSSKSNKETSSTTPDEITKTPTKRKQSTANAPQTSSVCVAEPERKFPKTPPRSHALRRAGDTDHARIVTPSTSVLAHEKKSGKNEVSVSTNARRSLDTELIPCLNEDFEKRTKTEHQEHDACPLEAIPSP